MPNTEFLTPDELCLRYKNTITIRTLANWRSQGPGFGPGFIKAGGKVLYPLMCILEWEHKRRFGAIAAALLIKIHFGGLDNFTDLLGALL